ncbi:Gfo/Idh/MocA family protein [Streptomyces sp. NPDC059255]|uniref:Gfo/Idh/MocA family protein n=1 Tax=Streptomyces sp. NPDC059255 TaxID=3346793 RepID=UPI0036C274DD
MAASPLPVPVVLVGAHGYGRWHLQNLARLTRAGAGAQLAGICDPVPLTPELRRLAGDVPVVARLDDLAAAVQPQVTIVSTPIHTHAELALTAARAGSDILLEKPPTPTLADFERLVADLDTTGRLCQVGFQSLGSAALPAVRALVANGAIGEVRGITAAGAWQRDRSYYLRAAWAGRRQLDGRPVVDGAMTNPFAHALETALALDGTADEQDVTDVRVELFRANPIESDDTSCLRLRTAHGTTVTVAVTLAADEVVEPYVVVHGTAGRVLLDYRIGRVRLERGGTVEVTDHGSTDLLTNLVVHRRDPTVPLLAPLGRTRAFMQVVDRVRLAPDPVEIPDRYRTVVGEGPSTLHTVPGIAAAVTRAADEGALFSELDLPWARHEATSGE